MLSNETTNDCEKPRILTLDNFSYLFWKEGNKLIFSNNFSTPYSIFEEEGLTNYDVLIQENTIITCVSIHEDELFSLKMKKYDIITSCWSENVLLFVDSYYVQLTSSIINLMTDPISQETHVSWTYCNDITGKERLCLGNLYGDVLSNIKVIDEALLHYHERHCNPVILNNTFFFIVKVFNASKFQDWFTKYDPSSGKSILESYESDAYIFQLLILNCSLLLFKMNSLTVILENFSTQEKMILFERSSWLPKTSNIDVKVKNSGMIFIGSSSGDFGAKEIYISMINFTGYLKSYNCISSPLNSFRESFKVYLQELSISIMNNGSILWTDRTSITGTYVYNIFYSQNMIYNQQDENILQYNFVGMWWLVPVIIGGLLLYGYMKIKK